MKLIHETFIESARKLGKELNPNALECLKTFLDTRDPKILTGVFRGSIQLCEVFIIRCYQDHLLPVSYFSFLLRHYIIKQGAGSLYKENDRLLYEMLDFAGFDELNLDSDKDFIRDQPETITIYRGGFPEGGFDLFWSMEKEKAMKYLIKGYHDYLWEAEISKSGIYICKSKGAEIIFNPLSQISRKVIGRLNQSGVYCPVIPEREIADL